MPKPHTLTSNDLIKAAQKAKAKAYAPYSKFKVGAALLTKNSQVYTGCNVENASYGLTCCAERNAVFDAVGRGERKFIAIAIVSDSLEPTAPCGACRQVLNEFAPEMEVIMAGAKGKVKTRKLKQLLPDSYGPKSLKKK